MSVTPPEIEHLFRQHAPRVRRMVGGLAESTADDACQLAWLRLLVHRQGVQREAAVSWLIRTAQREALKQTHRAERLSSLEDLLEQVGETVVDRVAPSPEDMREPYRRLEELDYLPARQRRALWLHAAGFSYSEIAAHEGWTRRTVERQLTRANHAVQAA
jgi:RNA polymerase sigma factor (sigma-70 family)